MSDEQQPKTRIRWLPMIFCTVVGVLLIRLTFAIAGETKAEDVKLSLLVEASAALVFLALFFLLERSFTRQVTRTVVRQVQREVVAPFEQRLAGLSARIDDLQRNVDEQAEEQHAWHHDLVTAMEEPTFDNVAAALTEAARLNVIAHGAVRVQANTDPRGIWLNFSYGAYFLHGQPTADNAIRITAYPAEDSFGQIAEDWRPGETIVNVARRIHDGLRKTGNYSQAIDRPNWSLALRNVQRALGATLPDDAKIAGKLHRLVGDLAITDRGVEHLDGRLLVPVADVPSSAVTPWGADPKRTAWNPPRPHGVDELTWELVIMKAPDLIGNGKQLPFFGSPSIETWIPKGVGDNA